MATYQLNRRDLERFWTKVRVDSATGCWEWEGSFTSDKGAAVRLPKITLRGKEVGARRLSYLIHFGEMPRQVGCTCGNRSCVSPRHLTPLRSPTDVVGKVYETNSSDKWQRVNETLVRKVITLRRMGHNQPAIARLLKLKQSKVCMILRMTKLCRENKLKSYGGKNREKVARKYGRSAAVPAGKVHV